MIQSYHDISLAHKRVLITGGHGFIGRYLIEALTSAGAKVDVLVRTLEESLSDPVQHVGDIRDAQMVEKVVRTVNPDVIFHLAAYKERSSALSDFKTAIDVNLIGSLHVYEAAARLSNLSLIVTLGTAEEYGSNAVPFDETMREMPVNAYSFSKACLSKLCEVLHTVQGVPGIVLRPTLVYGPGQTSDMFIPALIHALVENRSFPMTEGMQTRDFLYITDLIAAMLQTMKAGNIGGEIINIGSGTPVKIVELARMLEKMIDRPGLVKPGSLPYRSGEIMEYYVDCRKAQDLLHWQPEVSLEDGLQRTIEYYQERSE